MDDTNEQAELWNGPAGRAWVEQQDLLDRTFKPFEAIIVDAVAATSARRVLDIGCGTGATTLAIARALGSNGRVAGIDISEPMLALARTRAEREHARAAFIAADAQTHAFEPRSLDLIVSRFGVMFFDDPVRAFANLRSAMAEKGELNVIAWRSPADNPFMTIAERTAAPLLPDLPARKKDGPGQFAFADDQRVRAILEDSGWIGIDIRPVDVDCTFPANELERYITRLGPVGVFLHDADAATRAHIVSVVRPAFDPYVHGDDVRFISACWMIGARAS